MIWERSITSGLIVLTPIIVTGLVVYWFFRFIAGLPLIIGRVSNPLFRVVMTLGVFALFVFCGWVSNAHCCKSACWNND